MVAKAQLLPHSKDMSSRTATVEHFTRRMFTRIITSLARNLREEELSVAQVATLYVLDERGTLRVNEVGAVLDRPAPSTSRLVDDLVERGFVERREDPADRRARVLSLTAKGQRFIARAGEARVKTILDAARELPESASALFLAAVGKKPER